MSDSGTRWDVVPTFGSIDLKQGYVFTEYLAYVLSTYGSTTKMTGGFATVYGLDEQQFTVFGSFSVGEAGFVRYVFTDPTGTFDDFAIFATSETDPVQGHVLSVSSASTGGVGNDWTRHHVVFYPPRGAQYIVPYNTLVSVPAATPQYLDAHQMEILPFDAANTPTPYQHARELQVRVRPDRVNLAADPLRAAQTFTSTHQQTLIHVTPGEIYTVSVLASIFGAVDDVKVYVNGALTQVGLQEQGLTSGRIWTTFRAAAASVIVSVSPSRRGVVGSFGGFNTEPFGTEPFGGGAIELRHCLVEEGISLRPWFDSTSTDDEGGTYLPNPSTGHSLYYANRSDRAFLVQRTLEENAPFGINVGTIEYGTSE